MDVKERFKMIMDREGLTAGAFAESIGVAQATISHILGARNKYPSTEVVLRLQQRYPDIDLNWLLTGEGSMSKEGHPASPSAEGDMEYPLFADNPVIAAKEPDVPEYRKEMPSGNTSKAQQEIVRQDIIYKEKPARKITEIRIFFDDNTYETFKPEK